MEGLRERERERGWRERERGKEKRDRRELCPLRCREDAFFEAGVDFFLHIPCFWVFGSCLIRVGLLKYVRAEGW